LGSIPFFYDIVKKPKKERKEIILDIFGTMVKLGKHLHPIIIDLNDYSGHHLRNLYVRNTNVTGLYVEYDGNRVLLYVVLMLSQHMNIPGVIKE
jgi:hypothetical protein